MGPRESKKGKRNAMCRIKSFKEFSFKGKDRNTAESRQRIKWPEKGFFFFMGEIIVCLMPMRIIH